MGVTIYIYNIYIYIYMYIYSVYHIHNQQYHGGHMKKTYSAYYIHNQQLIWVSLERKII